jgi:hypothetical protein
MMAEPVTLTGKLTTALGPLISRAAASYARAASSAVSNVPSHKRHPLKVHAEAQCQSDEREWQPPLFPYRKHRC